MNPKILAAFASGATAAAVVVFLAMRPVDHIVRVVAAPARPIANSPVQVIPAVLPESRTADDLVSVQPHPTPLPAVQRKKPSAMPIDDKKWPADKPEPVAVAANLPPQDSMRVETGVEDPPAPAPAPPEKPAPEIEPPTRTPHTVILRPGALITVRIGQTLSTEHARIGDGFFATLDGPVVIDGWIIAARGSRAEGRVVDADRSQLGLQLTAINTTDHQHLDIGTATFLKRGPSWQDRDTATVGGAAALGAIIGAAAGGGKGAAIGAVAGGAVGAGGVMATRNRSADVPVETRITFRVDQALSITEHLN